MKPLRYFARLGLKKLTYVEFMGTAVGGAFGGVGGALGALCSPPPFTFGTNTSKSDGLVIPISFIRFFS